LSAAQETLQNTALTQIHIAAGAKMVPFAGYSMPVQYPLGVLREHLHTREFAGLFDVSHMGQVKVAAKTEGDSVAALLEEILPVDLLDLPLDHQRYALLLNEQGGILDDLMAANLGAEFLLVVNAGCKHDDLAWMQAKAPKLEFTLQNDYSLLALQGPMAREVMASLCPEAAKLTFMQTGRFEIAGIPCWMSCSGYTGEDGFEISVANEFAEALASSLVAEESVQWIGLGARDSLRLESGLCLYGHDLSVEKTPVSANLKWAVSPARRDGGARAGGYIGAEAIMAEWYQGVSQKRVLLDVDGRAPVREGVSIVNADGDPCGVISSGGFAPSLKAPIAMAYIDASVVDNQTPVYAELRGKKVALTPRTKPFIEQRYFRG
jgi:aminomethyltransferase